MSDNYKKIRRYTISVVSWGVGTILSFLFDNPTVKIIALLFCVIATGVSLVILLMTLYGDIKNVWKRLENNFEVIRGLDKRLEKVLEVYEKANYKLEAIVESTDIFSKNCDMTRNTVLKSQNSILGKMNGRTSFYCDTTETNQALIRLLIENREIDKLRIICYGRHGFGEITQTLSDKNLALEAEVIMCNALENTEICQKDDKEDILKQANRMAESGMKVYLSDIPPSVRACTAYINEKPVWSTTQSYQFKIVESGSNKKTLARPAHSLIIVCDENSSHMDFDRVASNFDKEFNRLKQASRFMIFRDQNGKVVRKNLTI